MRAAGVSGAPGQKVVGEGRGLRLAGGVEQHLLIERSADPLGEAAKDLAVDDERIDEDAAVLDDDIVEDLDLAELGVDGDDDRVGRVAEDAGIARGRIAAGRFEAAGIDVCGEILRAPIPGPRDRRERDFAGRTAHRVRSRSARLRDGPG